MPKKALIHRAPIDLPLVFEPATGSFLVVVVPEEMPAPDLAALIRQFT